MTNSTELMKHNPNNKPLEELKWDFRDILHDTAEVLEPFHTPDSVTLRSEDVSFGTFNDGRLTTTYTNDGVNHTGSILFTSEDASKNFFVYQQDKTGTPNKLWQSSDNKKNTSRKILQDIELNWPSDEHFPQKEVRDLIFPPEDADDQNPDITPEYIFGLLDRYTLAARFSTDTKKATGEHTYEMRWNYNDVQANFDNGSFVYESATFAIVGDEHNNLLGISADIIIPYPVTGVTVPCNCHISCDKEGNIAVTASYVNRKTGERKELQIMNYEGILATLTATLKEMVSEKALVS